MLERVRADALEPSTTDAPEVIERERTRTLLAVTSLVLGYARTTPTVVFVDDVDWADVATIDLLRHLMFRLDDEHVPLLVLATSRADPTARAGEGVARLRSEPRTAVVHLNPLTRLEATELARERQPGCPIDRARDLATASGGNPLLVEALVRDERSSPALLGAASTHPMMVAVGATLESLSKPAARVALATAVLGPDAERAAVLTLSDTSESAIVEAIDAGVLVEDGATLAFSHPIYAHTAYSRASSATRREQHARAASIVHEDRAIAHHLVAGGALIDDDALKCVRSAGNDALARGAWDEAARYYEAALTRSQAPAELAELHRRAGLSRRGNLQLAQAVTHFEAALHLLGPDADAATRAELHLWRIRCGIGTREMLSVVADREPLEELVDELEADDPELAAEALVELSQSYWVEWRMKQAAQCARRAMAIAEEHDDHSAYARATTALSVPQWARYDLHGSLATLEDGVAHARAAADESLLAGGPVFRVPLVLTWLGRFDEAEARALECCDIAERTQYPLELGLPLAALTQIAVARGDFDQAEQYAHRALLLQRLSGLPLGRRALPARHRGRARGARPVRAGARGAGHVVGDRRRARADHRRPLLPLGHRVRAPSGRARCAPPRPAPRTARGRGRVGGAGGRARAAGRRLRRPARGARPPGRDRTARRGAHRRHRVAGGAPPRRGAGPPRRRGRRHRHPAARHRPRPRAARGPRAGRARRPTSPPSTSGGASAATGSRCSTRRSPPSAASASSTTWPARSS